MKEEIGDLAYFTRTSRVLAMRLKLKMNAKTKLGFMKHNNIILRQ